MEKAEKVLYKSLNKIAAEQNYIDPEIKVSKVSTEGANYTSVLFAVTISGKGKDDLNLFAKVAVFGEKMREKTPMRMFDTEHRFYTELHQEYRDLEEKHGLQEQHRLKVPKIYDCSPILYEETVVMENLATKGYTLQDRFKPVDWEYAAAAFTELAKFHALSVALKHEKPDCFEKFSKDFEYAMEGKEDQMKGFIGNGLKASMKSTTEENKERIRSFMNKPEVYKEYASVFKPGDRPVIRHGDFRPSNMLSKVNEDGILDLILVDYQTLVCGSPIVDLYFFIFLGTDKQFRDKYFDQLLEHYYSQFSAAIARLGMDPEQKYPKKVFDDEVKKNLPYGLMVTIAILSLVMVDSAQAPVLTGDVDFSNYQATMTDDAYTVRLNGLIEDFIRWKIL